MPALLIFFCLATPAVARAETSLEIVDDKTAGGARIKIDQVVPEHGEPKPKNLSIVVPVGLAKSIAEQAPRGVRVSMSGGYNSTLTLIFGAGDDAITVHRNESGKIRVQYGFATKAPAFYFGRTPRGKMMAPGQFASTSGVTQKGATLIDPATLAIDTSTTFDGKTMRWFAATARTMKGLAPGAGKAVTYRGASATLASSSPTRFNGVVPVKGAAKKVQAVRKQANARRKAQHQKKRAAQLDALHLPPLTGTEVPVGSRPMYPQETDSSCVIASSRMAIATTIGKNIPERALREHSAVILSGYGGYGVRPEVAQFGLNSYRKGTNLASVPELLEKVGVPSRSVSSMSSKSALIRQLARWTTTGKVAIISHYNPDKSRHAVLVDKVKFVRGRPYLEIRCPSGRTYTYDPDSTSNPLRYRFEPGKLDHSHVAVLVGSEAEVARIIADRRAQRKAATKARKAAGRINRPRRVQQAAESRARKAARTKVPLAREPLTAEATVPLTAKATVSPAPGATVPLAAGATVPLAAGAKVAPRRPFGRLRKMVQQVFHR